jgi:hypothetical protein
MPCVWLDVFGDATATVRLPNGTRITRTVRRSDSANGTGDIVLMPLMLNYKVARDF